MDANWNEGISIAYGAGLRDAKASIRKGPPNDFTAAYEEGLLHGGASDVVKQAQMAGMSAADEEALKPISHVLEVNSCEASRLCDQWDKPTKKSTVPFGRRLISAAYAARDAEKATDKAQDVQGSAHQSALVKHESAENTYRKLASAAKETGLSEVAGKLRVEAKYHHKMMRMHLQALHVGPRGGRYRKSRSGTKVYKQ